jgi:hypothetical protein
MVLLEIYGWLWEHGVTQDISLASRGWDVRELGQYIASVSLPQPAWLQQFVDIKLLYQQKLGAKPESRAEMAKGMGLEISDYECNQVCRSIETCKLLAEIYRRLSAMSEVECDE